MVVDDEMSLRRLFWRFISSEDCKVDTAGNAMEALTMCREKKFDLAFVDVELKGGMDGIQLSKILRSQMEGLAIVITSARFENGPQAEAEGFEFFMKGVDFDLNRLGSFVKKHTGLDPYARLKNKDA